MTKKPQDISFLEAARILEEYAMKVTTRECRLRAAARVVLQEALRQEPPCCGQEAASP